MVLVGVAVLFLCEKDSSVCVAVCRIQNLRWGLKRLWAGNDCCCKTNRLVSPQLSGFTTGRSSRIFTSYITSPGQTRTASSHMNTLLLNDIRRFSFNITCFLFGGQSHTRLYRGVFVLQWHPPLFVQHSYYLRDKGFSSQARQSDSG